MSVDLSKYTALSFDCYGTLIDWETGILGVMRPWAEECGLDADDERLLRTYAAAESAAERERPSASYPTILSEAFRAVGRSLGGAVDAEWSERLGASVPNWPAFEDSSGALATLAPHYELLVVSNVHGAGFAASNVRLQGEFAAIITADDVGAYKPADGHFLALDRALQDLGIERGRLLHVAQSLFHDHVPARRHGFDSVWINRRHGRPGWGATPEPTDQVSYLAEFSSLAALAAAVEMAFR